MDDFLHCPVCGNKLRNHNLDNKILHRIGKTSDYVQRLCVGNHNHTLMSWVDKKTKQVDLLKVSLKPNYSRFIEIDFVNQKCRISCLKAGLPFYIEVPKMIEPDFPHLEKLKEKVSMYIIFS